MSELKEWLKLIAVGVIAVCIGVYGFQLLVFVAMIAGLAKFHR
jgi:hypothetical protein